MAPTGASVLIDGVAVTGFQPIGASGYSVTHQQLCTEADGGCAGVHRATGTQPFGLMVYGYSPSTAYAFPAGYNLLP